MRISSSFKELGLRVKGYRALGVAVWGLKAVSGFSDSRALASGFCAWDFRAWYDVAVSFTI